MKEKLSVLLVVLLIATLCLAFDIRTIKALGTIYIQADGSIKPPEATISSLDNVTYTLTGDVNDSIVIKRSNIVIDGTYHIVRGDGTGNGFTMQDVVNVTVKNVRIEGCFDGIQLFNSSDNIITSNTVIGSSYEGVGVYYSSDNTVVDNNITNNQIAIAFYNSSNNSVFHNGFVNNAYQVYVESSINTWDNGYPAGGNYWSNYMGLDMCEGQYQNETGIDGIGDTAFTIDSSNKDRYPLMNPWMQPSPGHDVAVINAWSSKTVIGQGYNGDIKVFGANKGEYAETFNLTVYIESVAFASWTLHLEGGLTATIGLSWNTTDFSKKNYTISASATAVPGETDSTDNNCTWTVHVGVPGDVSSSVQGAYDGTVNMRDAQYMILQFNSKPGSPKWKPNVDVNNDLVVNMRDIQIVIMNFNKHE
jgi:parallel beta-helix repeat protein